MKDQIQNQHRAVDLCNKVYEKAILNDTYQE